MDNYTYQPSYPESGDSSPRSREIDFENPPPWEDSQNPPPNYKVKFMCSYGGKIQPRPHDNQLSYMGGETKILAVDRNIKFASLIAKLSAVCDGEGVSFKYQLPGEDLDALISVTNDDDLEHMMGEYDRLYRASPKPARLRLFLFPATATVPTVVSTRTFGSEETVKSEKERFVEALNSGPIHTITPPSAVAPPPAQAGNVDFLFGLEKGMAPPPLQQQQQQQQPPAPVVAAKLGDPISDPSVHEHEYPFPGFDERMMGSDPIQKHIQDLQRLRLEEQQGIYRRKSDDNLTGGFPVSAGGEYYVHKVPEKVSQIPVQGTVGVPTTGYWPEKQVTGGVFPTNSLGNDQQVYMIPAPGGGYHAPMVRSMTGPTTQGYYTVQRMAPEVYRDQQMYNVVQNVPSAVPSVGAAPPSLPPQGQQHKVATTYSDGYGMVRSATTGMVENPNYAHMAYDNGGGRQMYYAAQGGGVMAAPPPQQPQQGQAQFHGMPGVGSDVKVTLNQEAVKLIPKATTQASV